MKIDAFLTDNPTLRTSIEGATRGISVLSVTFALDTIKIQQQASSQTTPPSALTVVKFLYQKEGVRAFYRGFASQASHAVLKQAFIWPMAQALLPTLEGQKFPPISQNIITGLTVSTLDAAIFTPLEKWRIQSALKKQIFSFSAFFQNGWQGAKTSWLRSSVGWCTFFVAQKHLRDAHKKEEHSDLKLYQTIGIGLQISLLVTVISLPFDVANTLKQTSNSILLKRLLVEGKPLASKIQNLTCFMYRGFSIRFLGSAIHNIASVALMERISKRE